jgi:hypothetical protein
MHRHNPQRGLIFVYHDDEAADESCDSRFRAARKKDFILPASGTGIK